jgi:hypothetical protein
MTVVDEVMVSTVEVGLMPPDLAPMQNAMG